MGVSRRFTALTGRGVSRVLFGDGHLSRPRRTGPRERGRLSTSDLGEQPDSGHVGDCCGEDCPFQPASLSARPEWSLLLSPRSPATPVWTVDASPRLSGFRRTPSLCAARTFLCRRERRQRPSSRPAPFGCQRAATGRGRSWVERIYAPTEGSGALRNGAEGETRTPTSFLTTP